MYIISEVILWVSIITSLLIVVIYTKLNIPNQLFCISLILSTVVELFAMSWANLGKNNLIFFHINTLLEFTLLTLFFSSLFSFKSRGILWWILGLGMTFIVSNTLIVQPIYIMNTISLTALSIYFIGCTLYYFYKNIDQEDFQEQKKFTNYAVTSIFVVHSLSMMVMLFGNYLMTSTSIIQDAIWILRASVTLIVKLLILIQLLRISFNYYLKKRLV